MSTTINRIVTAVDDAGRSVFADPEPMASSVTLGLTIHNIWGTADGIPTVGAGANPSAVPFPFFPGPGGHRVALVQFPPAAQDAHAESPDPEAAERAAAGAAADQPGLLDVFDPDDPGFHITDSIDYGFCVDGEMWLVLDDGAERHITPGTLVVQRGTRHAWQNRSERPCTMLYVILGAERS